MKRKRRQLKTRIVFLSMVIFTAYCVVSIAAIEESISQKKQQTTEITNQIVTAKTDNNVLSQLLQNGVDSDYIIDMAREKLGLVFPNEHLYIDINGP